MAKTITTITNEQLAKCPEYVAKWTKIGTCTDRINRQRATEAIHLAYSKADPPLAPPKKIMFFSSPAAALTGVHIHEYLLAHPDLDIKKMTPKQEQDMIDHIKKNAQYITGGFGSMDAGSLAFYDYFRTEFGLVTETEPLQGLNSVALECGWWWGFEDIVFMSDRPCILTLDDNNGLHNETGPALAYEDGFAIYAWHNVVIPDDKSWIITNPKKITIDDIDKESNADLQAIMIEKFGQRKYLDTIGAKIIDMDSMRVNPGIEGDDTCMQRILLEDKSGRKYFVGTDGSSKIVYFMNPVRSVKTCEEAHKSIQTLPKKSKCLAQS
jgi:hypothetical protein